MSLADQYAAQPPRPHRQCKVETIRLALPEDERAALDAMLASWSGSRIAAALEVEGYPVSASLVNDHRAEPRTCACGVS